MDKQKQIAKVRIGAILEKVNMGDGYANIDILADEIYHIVIPENSVVLTREEYEKLCDLAYFGNGEEVIRKETAEKFAEMANERIAQRQGERDGYEAFTIDDKAKYDGDIVSLALFETLKEIMEGKTWNIE